MSPPMLKKQNGQSLVQVLVAAAIGMTLLLTTITLLANVSRENQGLTEKLAAADFQQMLIQSYGDGSVCSQIATQTPIKFDGTHAVPGDPKNPTVTINIPNLPSSIVAGAPPIATPNAAASALIGTLVVSPTNPFQLTNIQGAAGVYTANLVVNFDSSRLIRPLRPASVKVKLSTTASGAMQTVTGCSGAATSLGSGTLCGMQGFTCTGIGPANLVGISIPCQGSNLTATCNCENCDLTLPAFRTASGCPSGYTANVIPGLVTTGGVEQGTITCAKN